MAIIVLLASLVAATALYARRRAREGRTRVQLKTIEAALVQNYSENSFYPGPYNGRLKIADIEALVDAQGNKYIDLTNEVFSETVRNGTYFTDAFGNSFYYRSQQPAGQMVNAKSFDLWSYGLDGQEGDMMDENNDDITNWKRPN